MNIIGNSSFNSFIEKVKRENLSVICYGAGLVSLSLEHIFEDAGILGNIKMFIDGDVKKQGTKFDYANRNIGIYGVDELLKADLSNSVLLITVEVFGAIIEQLNQYPQLDNQPCYIFAELNQSYIRSRTVAEIPVIFPPKIPKVIHYCWLGGGRMTQDMLDCIASWREHNTDYEIMQWNEDNYDVYRNSYMRQSYEAKKYAFTADFLRLDVLYRHGGIYLDTDVKCLKSFDSLLHNDAFAIYLEWAVPTFAISGSIAGLPIFKQLRDEPRAIIDFINSDGSFNQKISSWYEAAVLKQHGFRQDFSYQNIEGIAVYPPEYFATYSRLGFNREVTDRTYAVHMLQRTWIDKERKAEIEVTDKYVKMEEII